MNHEADLNDVENRLKEIEKIAQDSSLEKIRFNHEFVQSISNGTESDRYRCERYINRVQFMVNDKYFPLKVQRRAFSCFNNIFLVSLKAFHSNTKLFSFFPPT